jgi:hypothetical protein
VIATVAWSANGAARELWVASDAKRDPRSLVSEDILGDCPPPEEPLPGVA